MSDEVKTEVPTNEATQETSTELGFTGTINYLDTKMLNKVYKTASIISQASIVPDTYKNRPENVLIAMDIASRCEFSLMQVMQSLYIVKGQPSWSGQFCLGAIKACGKYKNVKYVWTGENESDPNYGCYLLAQEVDTGEVVKGTTVNWRMVKAYGWDAKNGSQWKCNPEQMFKYRAAAYFARTECPEVLMGLQTADEVRDVKGNEPEHTREKVVMTLDNGSEVIENG